MKPIAHIHTDFPTKFGIPRQSGIVNELKASIIFEEEYRQREAFRGLEKFSHIWLIWEFSENKDKKWSPTVRPPKLGGNTRMGVFATRSPFRPNPIGLSCVRLESIEYNKVKGPILHITGADLMDNTPIYDIKPYLAYVDSKPEAIGGFTEEIVHKEYDVIFENECEGILPLEKEIALIEILKQDPRPSYQDDRDRVYGMEFDRWEIGFAILEDRIYIKRIEENAKESN